ncbi:TPA: hypothetical protein VLQ55_000905 [Streptococcus pyogenes]|nr:hypothetical protein [Streptococcus pyogenes]HER6486153.1 hypothetical protein [Streptococcus pyogenes]HER6487684.1 hypothetical protein [Streptococcus pyogenes]HER6492697.1 hypothetical protein [Streptococcus pyogenes]
MRPKRYPYQKNKLIIQSKNAKTKIELDSGKITINAEEIKVGNLVNEISKVQLAKEKVSETIGQDKKPLGDIYAKVDWINQDECLQLLATTKEKAEELGKLIQQLNDAFFVKTPTTKNNTIFFSRA